MQNWWKYIVNFVSFIILLLNIYVNVLPKQFEYIVLIIVDVLRYIFLSYILSRAIRILITSAYPTLRVTIPSQRWPALDGLRLFAFLLVFLHHAPPFTSENHIFIEKISRIFQIQGWIGVDIFLTLSSFLLTYLGISEIKKSGRFSVMSYIYRRVFRIWPLYFSFMVFVYLTSLHFEDNNLTFGKAFQIHLPYFAVFVGNISYFARQDVFPENIAHLWTISLEEQYYALICLSIILYGRKREKTAYYFFILFIIGCISKVFIIYYQIAYPAIWVLPMARLDTISIGGLTALLLVRLEYGRSPIVNIGYLLNISTVCLILSLVFIPDPRSLTIDNFLTTLIPSVLTSITIIQCTYKKSILRTFLSFRPFELIGKITFGMYVFHVFGIRLAYQLILGNNQELYFSKYFLFIVSSLLITIILALISYFGLEITFLRMKDRAAVRDLASRTEQPQII